MTRLKIGTLILGLSLFAEPAFALDWQDIKGKHFIVRYAAESDRDIAQRVLKKAEVYYRRIGSQIGYTRYGDFWTWEDRVQIMIYPDQETFMAETGQPIWSKGSADRDAYVFEHRTIATWRQENHFLESLLPHEISHLIIRDFIGRQHIPIWFDEGVAQLQESEKSQIAEAMMRILISRDQYIPLASLVRWDIREEKDVQKVKIFYAQSLSIIEFMITRFGSSSFGRLCRLMRDGRGFEEALSGAYTNRVESLDQLEQYWVNSLGP